MASPQSRPPSSVDGNVGKARQIPAQIRRFRKNIIGRPPLGELPSLQINKKQALPQIFFKEEMYRLAF